MVAGQEKELILGSGLCEHPTLAYMQVVVEFEVAVREYL